MCGIAGYINFKDNFINDTSRHSAVVREMGKRLRHRGPDSFGEWVGEHCALSHTRLAVIDIDRGKQPMQKTEQGYEFIITYNGELYNTDELRNDLKKYGYTFTTHSDTEVVLYSYIHYGENFAKRLNGIYALCIWDSMRQQAVLYRDRFGVKPLFYMHRDDIFIFASEQKGILAYPGVRAEIDKTGLCELLGMSPARTAGEGVFRGMHEVLPGHMMIISRRGAKQLPYWCLESREHTDSYEDTVATVKELFYDSVKRQLVSDVPIAAFLSGGLDSSAITAIGALEMQKEGKTLSTYSFDYEGNDKYFRASSFQPDADSPWVKRMTEEFSTDHKYLVCPTNKLTELLEEALMAKDLPGMADVDASLLYFCREVKKHHTVVLSGECSDEIFGGYPWFSDPKAFDRHAFPWCYDMSIRNSVLIPEVAETLNLDLYSSIRYQESVDKTPRCPSDNPEEARRREIAWLNLNWFMTNLLDRKDRMSMASGLEVRVPFCDHRLVEYVWNIPWEMKNKDNVSKGILREAMRGILPDDILFRKKSPYPKTHNPAYEEAVRQMLLDTISDPNAPVLAVMDKDLIEEACRKPFDYGKPFFGQLMAGPQFLGYILQVNFWLKNFKPYIV